MFNSYTYNYYYTCTCINFQIAKKGFITLLNLECEQLGENDLVEIVKVFLSHEQFDLNYTENVCSK